jgi:hypothetical protein
MGRTVSVFNTIALALEKGYDIPDFGRRFRLCQDMAFEPLLKILDYLNSILQILSEYLMCCRC